MKTRSTRKLGRSKPSREQYARVLVVSEGSETEPHYIIGLRDLYRLSQANVIVNGAGVSPSVVVQKAIDIFSDDGDYDKVYCVFDRDEHADYNDAVQRIKSQKPTGLFEAVISNPCFEYWILLHFILTTAPYNKTGQLTAAKCVLRELKKHLPDYEKSGKDVFEALRDRIPTAVKHATGALKTVTDAGTENPTTRMHLLVNYFSEIKKKT